MPGKAWTPTSKSATRSSKASKGLQATTGWDAAMASSGIATVKVLPWPTRLRTAYPPPVPLYDPFHDGQAQPGALFSLGSLRAGPVEGLEYLTQFPFGNALPLVGHVQHQVVLEYSQVGPHHSLAVGILKRVGNQVLHDLAHLAVVDANPLR